MKYRGWHRNGQTEVFEKFLDVRGENDLRFSSSLP